MAIPAGDSYSAASGATIYGGRVAPVLPSTLPLWAQASELNKPLEIPNSSGAGGAPVHIFGGYAVRQDTGELFASLNGGHGDSSDNRVTSFPLLSDNPVWELRSAASAEEDRVYDVAYYLDGKPTSRHTYDYTLWVPQVNRIMHVGVRAAAGNAFSFGAVDGFNPDTNLWDPAGTWVSTDGNHGGGLDPTRGHVWTNNWQRFDATTNTINKPISTHATPIRFPIVHHPGLDIMYSLMWGTNISGSGSAFNSSKWNADGTGVQVAVTYNDSPGYTQFQADRLTTAGGQASDASAMTYDTANDCFYWYNGRLDNANRLYKIIPNSGTVWDMEIFEWAPDSIVMPSVPTAGMCGRLKYIGALNGFILCPSGNGVIYLVRTS